jgi:UDP-glucose 4-epimerase
VPEPRSPYGIGKLTIEHYLRYFKFTHNLDYIVYRIANPYGPGQNIYGKQGVIPIFMHRLLTHQPITVYDDGSMVRDYIYIDDLVTMINASFDKPGRFDTYNLGSGQGHTVNDIISAIETSTGSNFEKTIVKTPVTFVQRSVLNTARFTEEFGNKAITSLEEGIARTWDYVKQLG